jgi:hypothetical protein
MTASLSQRVAVALLTGALTCAGPALTPAAAAMHHGGGGHGGGFHGGGFHGGGMHRGGGWGGHYAGGYHRHYGYGGGYYGGYGYYGGPGCLPVLGIVTGNFCNYYY